MIVVAIIIITIFVIGFVVFRKVDYKEYSPSSKVYIPFYKISIPIVKSLWESKSGWIKKCVLNHQVIESLKQINPTDRTFKQVKQFYVEKIALSFLILFIGSILAILSMATQKNQNTIIQDRFIERGTYMEGRKSQEIKVAVEKELQDQEIDIKIDEQQLTQEEVFDLFKQVKEQVDKKFLKKNKSCMEVRSNLYLPTELDHFPIQIEWDTDNFKIVGNDGEVNNEDLDENGSMVTLTATLTYKTYSESYDIKVKVLPPILSDSEKLIKSILEKVQAANQNSITEHYLELPLSIDGKKIKWSENKGNSTGIILVFGLIGAFVIYYGKDKDLESKVKKRDQQLLSDYPNIVSKLTLLLGAGMTVKGAWQKIVLDYREKKETNCKYYRYAYEEMLITYYEILSGVSELKAYEEFGKRTKNQRFIKLSALFTQNLRKGSRGLSKILESESLDAFEDRKAYAKTVGEEAGTKLMMPMFLNLILVLILIMIPACMSFQM